MVKEVYLNPDNDYQKFVNAFQRNNPMLACPYVVKKANELWKEIKKDKAKVKFLKPNFTFFVKEFCEVL